MSCFIFINEMLLDHCKGVVLKLNVRKLGALLLSFAIFLSVIVMPQPAYAAEKKGNKYPIVLCHGNAGWGRDEMLGYRYWGGLVDLQKKLADAGYPTYTAAVGPFSSNWDRACELYAYIKGGTVDYGEAHSKNHGHARYGKTFPGLYPEWGTETDGGLNKIHLIAHSQGGQTSRMLIQLLEEGSEEEREGTQTNLNPLFEGGKSWVASLTTLASPHNGTTLADVDIYKLKDFATYLISAAAAATGKGLEPVYDFKLDQWGLKRQSGESYTHYAKRVMKSSIWNGKVRDFSFWDLSTTGAAEQNAWVTAKDDVYYFSYATCATTEQRLTGHQIGKPLLMNPALFAPAAVIGLYTRTGKEQPDIDRTWWCNDGIVNTISAKGPSVNSTDEIVDYDGTPQIGKWNYMGVKNLDHLAIVGIGKYNVTDLYLTIAKNVRRLPVVS